MTKIDYKQRYNEDMEYILKELDTLQKVVNLLHSVAIQLNANVDTMESLTAVKQSLDMVVNNIKTKTNYVMKEKENDKR